MCAVVKLEGSSFFQSSQRMGMLVLAILGLALIYLFQDFDVLSGVLSVEWHPYIHFAVRKTFRVFLNDSCMLLALHAWFYERSVTAMAWKLQLLDTLILLPLYLILKLLWEGDSELSSPLLSQLHRLIVNPTIMILLIPAVYYQRMVRKIN